MDDLNALRRLRDDAPVADRTRLVPVRQRLLDEISDARPRSPRRARLAAVVGAVAAVTVAALLMTQLGQVVDEAPSRQPYGTATEPRNDQWIYRKFITVAHMAVRTDPEAGQAKTPPRTAPRRFARETWSSYGGTASYYGLGGEEVKRDPHPAVLGAPKKLLAKVAKLPDEPTELKAALRVVIPIRDDWGGSRARADYRRIWLVLSQVDGVPRETRAALVRALRTVPGVVFEAPVKDELGRTAVTVRETLTNPSEERVDLLLAPETDDYLGSRTYPENSGGGGAFSVVTTQYESGLVRTAVVDRPGARPARGD